MTKFYQRVRGPQFTVVTIRLDRSDHQQLLKLALTLGGMSLPELIKRIIKGELVK